MNQSNPEFIVCTPESETDWQHYFHLRWLVLRAPWNQPPGSERSDNDNSAIHLMIKNKTSIVAIGSIHLIDCHTAQVRFMAVEPHFRRKGLGSMILQSLEQKAIALKVKRIILNARESALPFYEKNKFVRLKKTHQLFGCIQHYLMEKKL
ncbi:MAG: GNAT family N-acetyltransferase [Bacteroidia bacterium]|nr:GNAT family N-acetyltransferase [Bacteroidia bacterium]MCZ2277265.1 GNAT family N-acetyltransferase [Bacteroidia bacterium]